MASSLSTRQRINNRIFRAVHGRNLIYNACWEDPRLDRVALNLSSDDRLLVITSAGCNALDYLLAGCGEVNAVDVNPIQNALLELKSVAARTLDHEGFFAMFGQGGSPRVSTMYHDAVRAGLSEIARDYWDRHLKFFSGKGWRRSFYYRGTSGFLARLVLANLHTVHRLREPIERLLAARTVEEQQVIYRGDIERRIWTPWLKWFISRSLTLSLLGVPGPQRDQIVEQYPGGVSRFVRDSLEAVVCELPFHDNYFWRVYIQGHYTPECCPEYLRKENFDALRAALPRLRIHTGTVTDVLRGADPGFSRFVLLDHMDWMSCHNPAGLVDEWNAILAKARPGARVIFRSAGLKVHFLDHLRVRHAGRDVELGSLLKYHPEQAAELHARDRVHTYGSFHIVDLPA